MNLIDQLTKEQRRDDVSDFRVGDTVEVNVKITEGDRDRIHAFKGIVISRRGRGMGEMFTVRRIVAGEGVERTFPLHSPAIASIVVTGRGAVRRAKLYYLRQRIGKATQVRRQKAARTGEEPGAAETDAQEAAAPSQEAQTE